MEKDDSSRIYSLSLPFVLLTDSSSCSQQHISGWGLDDDVYFSEPQEVSTFVRTAKKDVNTVKPVTQVVDKSTESSKTDKKPNPPNPWSLQHDVGDLLGLE